jgi:pantoate--beta-alanine ligase
MGFLHDGHLSLVDHARRHARVDSVVMSIFVNPTQFGPNEDFDRYPRDRARDETMARQAGVDVLFLPDIEDIYPTGARTFVEVEGLGSVMCGASRPTHFRGVTTVVTKLFNIVLPHVAVFGQKDAQQFLILRRMVRDLKLDIDMRMAPIVREPDGLAMSSRNVYLNDDERRQALCLSQSLTIARRMIENGKTSTAEILDAMRSHIDAHPLARPDYVTIRDPDSLEELNVVKKPMLVALAVYVGKTRLIDNWILE